jgi:ubiquinone/menaquinone biosynthesis C-methylase UbiE
MFLIVFDISITNKKPLIFDGKNIPYPDNSFDICLCLSVLHHTQNQEPLIQEMKRVAPKILIIEDIPENLFDKLLGFLHSLASKIIYKSNQMKFRTNIEWKALFKECGLKIDKAKK